MSITIDLEQNQLKRLEKITSEMGITQSLDFHISEAIDLYIEELEFIQTAEQRASDVRSGKSKTYSLEEVLEQNGLSG